ncbi:MAG: M3 family oligoendopeptidase [Candidatus Riflebacteria bacterium]|nr:M3 family oligoendopeptidase [Candidatus Riflebacteria bacterium]
MSKGVKWDLTSVFKKFNGPDMIKFKKDMKNGFASFQKEASTTPALNAKNQAKWEKLFLEAQNLFAGMSHYRLYIECLCSAEATNGEYTKEEATLNLYQAEVAKNEMYLKMAFKDAKAEDFNAFISRPKLKANKFFLTELRETGKRTMASDLEALASDLSVDGFHSWGRLYNTISGKLNFDMHYPDGKVVNTPIAQCRSLMGNADRKIRKAAFDCGNKAWDSVADSCAACINGLAGNRLILANKRGYKNFLDVALEQARISRKTLNAIFEALDECRPFILKIAKAKAKAVGLNKLAFYDWEAPIDLPNADNFTWEEGVKVLDNAFGIAYPRLQEFLRFELKNKWVDSEPKAGKRPGAWCETSFRIGESRVFMSFTGSLNDISTLAHETGHAFHSEMMKDMVPYSQKYPMTLAETASTFAEKILADGILKDPKASDVLKLSVLTNSINDVISYMLDIPIRFKFEKAFHEERQNGEVSVARLKEIMSQTMRDTFGEMMEKGGENPYYWASKLHFYATDVTFYNFPYTFGYLLSCGLMSMFREEGAKFLPKYEAFLKFTGDEMAHKVAKKTLKVDLENKDFWVKAIMGHESDLNQFEKLIKKVMGKKK